MRCKITGSFLSRTLLLLSRYYLTMIINRLNYEEFFLMYVDNELTEAERTEVEVFVQQNPDLAEELAMLKDATLTVDEEMPLIDKSLLYKNEQAIGLTNYEEYFLLHLDNELKPKEKEEVEKFVLQHPQLQDEFTLLQQTKLPVEDIEFKDKASLYKTAKERRVIYFNWMRVAVAAAVIGLVATVWSIYPDGKNETGTVASTTKEPKTETVTKPSGTVNGQRAEKQIAVAEVITKKDVKVQKKQVAAIPVNELFAKEEKKKEVVRENGNLNQLPAPENNPVLAANRQREETSKTTTTAIIKPEAPKVSESFAKNDRDENETTSSITQHAVYREMDTEDEEEKSILVGGIEINRNKLRGLFKKATKIFDKKAKTDNDKTLQIASFEIKTK